MLRLDLELFGPPHTDCVRIPIVTRVIQRNRSHACVYGVTGKP